MAFLLTTYLVKRQLSTKLYASLFVFYFFKQQICIFSQKLSNENKQQLHKIQKGPTSLLYHVLLKKQNECIDYRLIILFFNILSYSEVPNRRADRNKRAGLETNSTLPAFLLSKLINEQGGIFGLLHEKL